MGFPSATSLCTSGAGQCGTREVGMGALNSRLRTRIIPEMTFTCSGTVTHWRAAGEFRDEGNANTNSVLSIWRERSSQPGTYDRVDGIQLGICGSEDPAPSVMGMSNVYECILPQSERLSVQPGDIVGIELPSDNRANFRLYFDANSGSTNYVFNSHGSTFSLSQASSTTQDQPQTSLTLEPIIQLTSTPIVLTTTTIDQVLSTTADLPTAPPLTSFETTSMSNTDLSTTTTTEVVSMSTAMPPTNIEASTTATVMEIQTSTNTPITMEETTTVDSESLGSTAEIPSGTNNAQATQTPTTSMTDGPTMTNAVTDHDLQTITRDASISTGLSTVTDHQTTTSNSEFIKSESNSNVGTIAGAVVGGIIGVLLVLIIVLSLVLVLRRQNQNGKTFTPPNDSTIVNPVFNGKPIVPNIEGSIH